MARKQKPLTCTFYMNGEPVDRLTPDQLERMARRMGEVMSIYYTAHPEEYERILSKDREDIKNKKEKCHETQVLHTPSVGLAHVHPHRAR